MDILPPKHETVERDGTRLHVARLESMERPEHSGRGAQDGRTLLFLHGWPEFWWTWSPVMERLSALGYDCVARPTCAASATATSIRTVARTRPGPRSMPGTRWRCWMR